MEFKLSTSDLQRLTIAIIDSSCSPTGVFNDRRMRKDAELREAHDRLGELLYKLNELCNEENGYTITLEVKEAEQEPKTELRNWIEQAIGKQWANPPAHTGYKGHREVFEIDWVDGTSQSYFIDWEEKRIEEVWPGLVRSARYPYEVISEARNG